MTILPRVASIRVSKASRKNVDDYDIREYDAMTDGSVGGYEWRNRGVGRRETSRLRTRSPVHILGDRVRKTD